MRKYYVKFGLSNNFNAGSKAMKDIMALLESRGYKAVPALPARCNKLLKLLDVPMLLLILVFKVGRGGMVVYFVPSNVWRIRFMSLFRKWIGFRLVCFINDVEFMRMERDAESVAAELKGMAVADVIMVPNENSRRILNSDYGMNVPMVSVGVWDYLSDGSFPSFSESDNTGAGGAVAFAGNLDKAPFIDDLGHVDLHFKIWGSGGKKGVPANVGFMGVEHPELLVKKMGACAWGLVWDGPSIDTCCGKMGAYLRFNNSHKCGLYLAAGIPLIVWAGSGMVDFVTKHKVGICVSSLSDAADVINVMSGMEYAEYKRNVLRVGKKVRSGEYFLRALDEMENLLNKANR